MFDDLSSIANQSQHISDVYSVISAVDISAKILYKQQQADLCFEIQQNAIEFAESIVTKLISNTIHESHTNYIKKILPSHAATETIAVVDKMIRTNEMEPDYIKNEQDQLIEDQEPEQANTDPWIRNKIITNKKTENYINDNDSSSIKKSVNSRLDVNSLKKKGFKKSVQGSKSKLDDLSAINSSFDMNINQLEPTPIELQDPLNISITEETLRNEKCVQQEKLENDRRIMLQKKQLAQKLEQEKINKMKKENKNLQFTYDFDGELLAVKKTKTGQLPPSYYNVNYGIREPIEEKEKSKKKKVLSRPHEGKKEKKVQIREDFVRGQGQQNFTDFQLEKGVNIIFNGVKKVGPHTDIDMMSLTNTNSNLRMAKKDYMRLTSTNTFQQKKELAQERMLKSAGDKFGFGLTVTVPDLPIPGTSQQKTPQNNQNQYNTTSNFPIIPMGGMGAMGATSSTGFGLNQIQEKQSRKSGGGGIIVNQTKFLDALTIQTGVIHEEDEDFLPPQQHEFKQAHERLQSPIDSYNLAMTGQNWGRGLGVGGIPRPQVNFNSKKAQEKDFHKTMGVLPKLRDRNLHTSEALTRNNMKSQESMRKKNFQQLRN